SWRIQIDLVQEMNAKLAIQLVANSGLDILQEVTIAGSFTGNLSTEIRAEHRCGALRVKSVDTHSETSWGRLRDTSRVR
ncbi:hypothetical protein K4H02_27585, partial [Mycobacterium tuberculosis]|nr:hypothetical protein [Mycobacterium tuberculosis]